MKKSGASSTENKKVSVHTGHRYRLRERFLRDGLEGFQDHNVLELILFYSIPQRDTNELAHNLIDRFGSLHGVFDADFEQLCSVKGVGENTASLLKMMPQLFRKYETDKIEEKDTSLNTCELVVEYASKFFKGVTEERLYLMCLDSNCKLLCFEHISSGTTRATMVDYRKITETALKTDASNILLVHNHPSGIVAPSPADINITMSVIDLFNKIGLKLNDHIIIGNGNEFISLSRSSKWKSVF